MCGFQHPPGFYAYRMQNNITAISAYFAKPLFLLLPSNDCCPASLDIRTYSRTSVTVTSHILMQSPVFSFPLTLYIIYHNINKYIYFFVTHSLRDSSMYSAAIHRTVWETNNRRHQCHSTKQYQKRSDWKFMRSLVIDALTADAILHIKTCRWIIYTRSMCTQTFTSPWQKRRCIRSKILCQPAGNVICINPLCRWKYSGIGSAPSYGRT